MQGLGIPVRVTPSLDGVVMGSKGVRLREAGVGRARKGVRSVGVLSNSGSAESAHRTHPLDDQPVTLDLVPSVASPLLSCRGRGVFTDQTPLSRVG